jgi:polysaccharide deacetylase 2 family uncharacterized protein YibQ
MLSVRRALALLVLLSPAALFAQQPAVAIVIDDLGDRWSTGESAVLLPGPIAMAFLPESAFTRRLAEQAHAAGKEVLLHLPLDPLVGKAHPLSLSRAETVDQREALLVRALAAVPYAVGVNNHQGSMMTERRDQMDWLMGRLREHGGLYFVDSYTTPLSVAYDAAREQGLGATRRQVFLDAVRNREAIAKAFTRLIQLAKTNGTALAIGHPFEETLEVLRQQLPQLQAQGVQLVSPSELIRLQEHRSPIRSRQLRLRLSERLTLSRIEPLAVSARRM